MAMFQSSWTWGVVADEEGGEGVGDRLPYSLLSGERFLLRWCRSKNADGYVGGDKSLWRGDAVNFKTLWGLEEYRSRLYHIS
jgi:hypothetical protein